MASVSVTGVLTMVAIVVPGPLYYCILPRLRGQEQEEESEIKGQRSDGAVREEASPMGYLLSLLGYSIGIGNLWRFPYLVGANGGGAFVFAYLVCLFLVSIPVFLSELAIGNQTRKSCLNCFHAIHPRWSGLALSQTTMVFMSSTFFNVLIAWAMVYVGASMLTPLPWDGDAGRSEEFWEKTVLNRYEEPVQSLTGFGPVQWGLVLSLLLVYLMNFFAIAFGKEVLEKVTWITVVGPCILLALLLVQSVGLEGAGDGIAFYIGKFEWSKLLDINLWATACSQILFSLGPGTGATITMSSFTPVKTDAFKTCMIVGLCNSAFSLTGGFAVFAILGNLAFRTGQDVAVLALQSGPGLVFIAMADGMLTFGDWQNVMSVLFFVMLVTLGLDSSFAWIGALVDLIQDFFLDSGRKVPKYQTTGAVCFLLFVIGIPYCTRSGEYLLAVMNRFVGVHYLLISVFVEVFIFSLVFTWERLAAGMKFARGAPVPLNGFWKFTLMFTAPIAPMLLTLTNIGADLLTPYEGYPGWLLLWGWGSLGLCCLVFVSTLHRKGEADLPPFPEADVELISG